jgi:putative transposase
MSKRLKKLSHSVYECKYHIIFCPKYRYKIFADEKMREFAHRQVYKLIEQKDHIEIIELNVQSDHVHVILSIAPKYSVSNVMGFLKGKLALNLFRNFEQLGKKYWGRHLWARGYCVTTVGLNEENVRKYVKFQEKQDRDAEQLGLNLK